MWLRSFYFDMNVWRSDVVFRQGVLTADEAEKMMEEAQKQMLESKNRLDADRQKQEAALHKKLSDRKKQKMDEQVIYANICTHVHTWLSACIGSTVLAPIIIIINV